MANLNKVMLIGRLTRDPESKVFEGGKVVKFGFAVNNRKRNAQTGTWEDVPVWIDCSAFDRAEGRKLATLIADTVRKGQQIFIEGRLTYEEWNDKDGNKRSALRVIVEDFQYLTPKETGGMGEAAPARPAAAPARSGYGNGGAKPSKPLYEAEPDEPPMEAPSGRGGDDDIPF